MSFVRQKDNTRLEVVHIVQRIDRVEQPGSVYGSTNIQELLLVRADEWVIKTDPQNS